MLYALRSGFACRSGLAHHLVGAFDLAAIIRAAIIPNVVSRSVVEAVHQFQGRRMKRTVSPCFVHQIKTA